MYGIQSKAKLIQRFGYCLLGLVVLEIIKPLSCKKFILLLRPQLRNIQTKGPYTN